MKSIFVSREEKDGKPSRSPKASPDRNSGTGESAPGVPYFLEGEGAPTVKQKIKVVQRPSAASRVAENEAAASAEEVRASSNSNEPRSSHDRQTSNDGSTSQLPENTRALMEDHFGADFGNVRIHSDENANRLADSFGANALTKGEDIYFNRGRYDPASNAGRGLLAHELAHVVQQKSKAAGQ
ncbi:MAG TPA: DUF4157 domain-containing protein, partial [Pyrinomonadaceae bacterium]|nr:DUF4157 domain-containing protein [Pyrinomonadaceae bacterium]